MDFGTALWFWAEDQQPAIYRSPVYPWMFLMRSRMKEICESFPDEPSSARAGGES